MKKHMMVLMEQIMKNHTKDYSVHHIQKHILVSIQNFGKQITLKHTVQIMKVHLIQHIQRIQSNEVHQYFLFYIDQYDILFFYPQKDIRLLLKM